MGSSDTDLRFQFCLLSSLTAIIPSFQIVNPLPFHLTLVSLWCSLSAQAVFCRAWLLEGAIKGPQKQHGRSGYVVWWYIVLPLVHCSFPSLSMSQATTLVWLGSEPLLNDPSLILLKLSLLTNAAPGKKNAWWCMRCDNFRIRAAFFISRHCTYWRQATDLQENSWGRLNNLLIYKGHKMMVHYCPGCSSYCSLASPKGKYVKKVLTAFE